jgi:hypothetical protein
MTLCDWCRFLRFSQSFHGLNALEHLVNVITRNVWLRANPTNQILLPNWAGSREF